MNRVVREPIGVVRIGIAAGEPEDALGQQILERVPHLPRLPILDEASGEAIDQPVARFRGLEQDRAAIRARVGLIERRDEGFVEEVWEEDSLWYRVGAQSKASVVGKSVVWQRLCTMRRLLCLYRNRPLRELSGLVGRLRRQKRQRFGRQAASACKAAARFKAASMFGQMFSAPTCSWNSPCRISPAGCLGAPQRINVRLVR